MAGRTDTGSAGMNQTSAVISADNKHRFSLWRSWTMTIPENIIAFIGLNPSTADDKEDDPTIRRCINFSKSWGFDAMRVVNIFSFRATDPKRLHCEKTPNHSLNDRSIIEAAKYSDKIVCMWGSHGLFLYRQEEVLKLLKGFQLYCFAVNGNGTPKHPLYLSKKTELISYPAQEAPG